MLLHLLCQCPQAGLPALIHILLMKVTFNYGYILSRATHSPHEMNSNSHVKAAQLKWADLSPFPDQLRLYEFFSHSLTQINPTTRIPLLPGLQDVSLDGEGASLGPEDFLLVPEAVSVGFGGSDGQASNRMIQSSYGLQYNRVR